jgi:hypothetical protein
VNKLYVCTTCSFLPARVRSPRTYEYTYSSQRLLPFKRTPATNTPTQRPADITFFLSFYIRLFISLYQVFVFPHTHSLYLFLSFGIFISKVIHTSCLVLQAHKTMTLTKKSETRNHHPDTNPN